MPHRPVPRHRNRLAASAPLLAGAALAALSAPGRAPAAQRSWANGGGGSFHAPGNWAGGVIPGTADDAIFDLNGGAGGPGGAGYTVTFGNNATNLAALIRTDVLNWNLNARTYTLTGAGLVVAQQADDVGRLTVFGGAVDTGPGNVTVGATAGARGTLTVSTGTTLSMADLRVGNVGAGSLLIQDGARVTLSDDMSLAAGGLASAGDLLVSGSGSTLAVADSATLGADGAATARVLNGAAVTSGQVSVGLGTTASGTLDLAGGGSSWTAAGNFTVGGTNTTRGGTGVVTVGPGANLTVSGSTSVLRVHGGGTLNLDGGTVTTNDLALPGGGALRFNAGTLNITRSANGLTVGTNGLFGSILELGPGKRIDVTNGAHVTPGSTLTLSGGQFSAGVLTNNGRIFLDSTASLLGDPSGDALTNNGLLTGRGQVAALLSNTTAGEVRVSAGDQIVFTNPADNHGNDGTINLLGSTLDFRTAGTVSNNGTGVVQGQGTLITAGAAGLSNAGTIRFTGASSHVFGDFTNATPPAGGSPSRVLVTGGGTASFYGDVALQAGSTLQVSLNSHAAFLGPVTAAAGTITGPGHKYFEGPANIAGLATAGATTVAPTGAVTADFVREASLTVDGGGTLAVRPRAAGGATSAVAALSVDAANGGRIDLADTALVVDYDPQSGPSPLPAVRALLDGGHAGGTWDGPGIHSTPADASTFALGYAESSLAVGAAGGTFAGRPVDGSAVLVRFTRYGDANVDGSVNVTDLGVLATNFGLAGGAGDWFEGDFNYSGTVDVTDLGLLATNFGLAAALDAGAQTPEQRAAASQEFAAALALYPQLQAAVPEPAAGATLVAATSGLVVGRRRRRT